MYLYDEVDSIDFLSDVIFFLARTRELLVLEYSDTKRLYSGGVSESKLG
jgi:hypothetical protein